MTIKTAIELQVKQPNLKGFRAELRQATVEAQQAVLTFGEFSPEAVKATQRVAQLKDQMEDFNDRVAAVNPDKFAQLNTVVSSVVNGFQAAQGAMVLLGGTTAQVEQTFVKLQAAMALSQGLEGLGKVQQQLKQIIASATTLQKTLAGSLGIIILIATNFERLVNIIPGLDKLGAILKEIGYNISDFFGLGIREAAIFKDIKEINELTEIELERQIGILSQGYGNEEKIFALRKQLIETRLNTVTKALELEQYADEEAKKELVKQQTQFNAELEILDKEKNRVLEENLQERTRAYEDYVDETNRLEIEREQLNIQRTEQNAKYLFDITQKEVDGRARILMAGSFDYIKFLERQQKAQEDILNNQRLNEIKNLEREFEDKKKLLGDNQEEIEGLTNLHNERLVQVEALYNSKISQNTENFNAKRLDYEIKKDQQIRDAKLQIAESTVSGLSSLAQIMLNDQSKIAKAQKMIALVEIGIDTAFAVSSLNKEAAKVSAQMAGVLGPATPAFTAAYYAQGIARILANVAKAKQVLSQKNPNVSGAVSGGSIGSNIGGVAPSMVTGSSLPQDTGGGKVYVLEGDITRAQQRVNGNQRVSTVE